MADLDRARLAKILALLGSSEAGERASAALKAHEMVRSLDMTWDDVLGGRITPAPTARKASQPAWMTGGARPGEAPEGWSAIVEYLHANLNRLGPCEVRVVRNIARYRGIPRQPAIDHLTSIYHRLSAEDAGGPSAGQEMAA